MERGQGLDISRPRPLAMAHESCHVPKADEGIRERVRVPQPAFGRHALEVQRLGTGKIVESLGGDAEESQGGRRGRCDPGSFAA